MHGAELAESDVDPDRQRVLDVGLAVPEGRTIGVRRAGAGERRLEGVAVRAECDSRGYCGSPDFKDWVFCVPKNKTDESALLMEPQYWFLEPINAGLPRKKVGKGPDDPKTALSRTMTDVSAFIYVTVKISDIWFRNINPDSLSQACGFRFTILPLSGFFPSFARYWVRYRSPGST
jgi:hypothetical protein